MGMSQSVLACLGGSPPLLDLAKGTSVSLGLEFREISSAEQIRSLGGVAPSIVVITAPALSESLLATVKSASSLGRAWFIVVIGNASSMDEDRVMEAGAVACLDPSQAMARLAYFIRNLLKCVRFENDARATELRISGDVTLRMPEYILTNSRKDHRLTPITGRLLECLAVHADTLTSSDELKRSAWGTPDGAEDHALHQQMRGLREVLDECGISDRLRCLRGKGYVLTTQDRQG